MAGLAEFAALAELGPGCGWLWVVVSHPFAMKLHPCDKGLSQGTPEAANGWGTGILLTPLTPLTPLTRPTPLYLPV